jgi:hypothetical protein
VCQLIKKNCNGQFWDLAVSCFDVAAFYSKKMYLLKRTAMAME